MSGDDLNRAYIGIGSNLGDRLRNCTEAVERIGRVEGCFRAGSSGWYRTEPVGVTGQEWYLNGILAVDTSLSPHELLGHLGVIEKAMGRVRKERWEARVLDLDLLLFGSECMDQEGLILPHPRMHTRRFVLVPLARMAPTLVHPVLGLTVTKLLETLTEEGQAVVPWGEE